MINQVCQSFPSMHLVADDGRKRGEEDAAGKFPADTLKLSFISEVPFGLKQNKKLTVCDAGQGLVEGGRVAVVGERDAHASRQEPPGQREGLLVQEEPGSEALVAHLLALQQQERRLVKQGHFSQLFPKTWGFFLEEISKVTGLKGFRGLLWGLEKRTAKHLFINGRRHWELRVGRPQ